jgi:hypothetical protein
MFKKLWSAIVYVMSGQLTQDNIDSYVDSRNPKNEAERAAAVQEYYRMRGGY